MLPEKNIEEVTIIIQNIRKLFTGRIGFVVMNEVMLADLLRMEDMYGVTLVLNDKYDFY